MSGPDAPLVRALGGVGREDLDLVGGKAASLGELTRLDLGVPAGFCLTTEAWRLFLRACPADRLGELLSSLSAPGAAAEELPGVASQLRELLEATPVPGAVERALLAAARELGPAGPWVVRSSATAEDLPQSSFAGQHDTYLNVRGEKELVESVRRCWASLYTDRAVAYRARNGTSQREVAMGVIVQRLLAPDAAGVLFSVDPVTQARSRLAVNAVLGLGEALVSGRATPDLWVVDKASLRIVSRELARKERALRPGGASGTVDEAVDARQQLEPALSDAQVTRLAEAGLRLERHFGAPQDVEWCAVGDELCILQSRPVTGLYPLPEELPRDGTLHVYLCFNHLQVMTDPVSPLGRSLIRLVLPFGKDGGVSAHSRYAIPAGGRLYIDATELLRRRLPRRRAPEGLRAADELMARALAQVVARPEFREQARHAPRAGLLRALREYLIPIGARTLAFLLWRRTRGVLDARAQWIRAETAAARAALDAAAPEKRLGLLYLFLGRLFQQKLERRLLPLMGAAVAAQALVARLCGRALDDPDLVALGRALPGNVTTEMDLAVGDLADVARRLPAVAARLREASGAVALSELDPVEGGARFRTELEQFLELHGMRGPSEIDVARPRWREDPTPLLRSVAGNLSSGDSGLHRRQHERLAREAEAATERLIRAARRGLSGFVRAPLVRHFVRVQRDLLGAREHPKLLLISFFDLAKDVLRERAEALVERGALGRAEDVFLLELDELHALAEGRPLSEDVAGLVVRRTAEQERFAALYPPRVLTSDGEVVQARHERDDLPEGALVGSGVSAGVVEGRARVVRDPSRDELRHGEVLVAPFTDPGWTPLFLHAAALVTEVGGLMTHGSVIAREFGLPAVVCVPDATRLIRTGQRVRVDGDRGFVQILDEAAPA